jgi:hypothetical protein
LFNSRRLLIEEIIYQIAEETPQQHTLKETLLSVPTTKNRKTAVITF